MQELEVWPRRDSEWLTEIPSSLQTRGQAAGDTVLRRKKDRSNNFPVSVALVSAQTCFPTHCVVPGRSRGCPAAGPCRMGQAGENPSSFSSAGVRKTRKQDSKVPRHDTPDKEAGEGTSSLSQASRAAISCRCRLSQLGGFDASLANSVSSRAGCALSPALKRFMNKAVLNIIVILSLLGNCCYKALSVCPHSYQVSLFRGVRHPWTSWNTFPLPDTFSSSSLLLCKSMKV